MKKNTRIRCPICGNYEIATQDHVPPKCCDNKGKRIIHYFYTKQRGIPAKKETQKGVHYDYICSNCNNGILGSNYDIELKKFYDSVVESDALIVNWIGDVSKICKCIFGHMLATNKYSSSVWDKEMRKYVLNDITPNSISLYLFYYPYDAIFTIKHAVPISIFNSYGRKNYDFPNNSMVDCLYFYPFAFIVTEKNTLSRGVDLIKLIQNNESSIELKKDGWIDAEDNKLLPPCWPCMISEAKEDNTVDAIVGGGDLDSFNISFKKQG